jgi:hypothetical protein
MKGSGWTYAKNQIVSTVYVSMQVLHMHCTRECNEEKILDNNSDVVLLKGDEHIYFTCG